jgi:adenylate cyclase class 2
MSARASGSRAAFVRLCVSPGNCGRACLNGYGYVSPTEGQYVRQRGPEHQVPPAIENDACGSIIGPEAHYAAAPVPFGGASRNHNYMIDNDLVSGAGRRNIELKARCPDRVAAQLAALHLGAASRGTVRQTDTYFRVPAGRLKLRENRPGNDTIIFYHRPDQLAFKASDYRIVPVSDAAATKALLTEALGVVAVVRKRRELLVWHNVRIHLDAVENLGDFVELEAVLTTEADADAGSHVGARSDAAALEAESLDRLERLTCALDIRPPDRLAGSYAELALTNP